jgi:DNA-binding HxlR family transcriptional regulator
MGWNCKSIARNYTQPMRKPRSADPMVCSIEAALKLIGEKWALLALREIVSGRFRFDDIAFNTGAPRDILTARLKTLEAAGVVQRCQYQGRPPRFEYHLAEAGERLFGILHAIREWGDAFARDDPENIVTFRHSCGAELHLEMRCAACGDEVGSGTVAGDREVRRSNAVARVS